MPNHLTLPEQQALVSQWRASGLTMFQFAKQHGVSFTNLQRWQARETKLTFARVELVNPPPKPALVVELAHTGHRVYVPPGFDAAELRRLMEALC